MHTTLISAQALASRLSDPQWLTVDCRFDLMKPASGEAAYHAGHIPGAIYAHLDRDLSSPVGPRTGRHPLPDPDRFAQTLSAWGVSADTQVIAYDADNGAFAARLWWLLRWVGHRAVAVLDGGLKAWMDAGMPTSREIPTRSYAHFDAKPDRSLWLDANEVAQKLREGWRLLDARAPERFAGKIEPIDPVAGHIPGAVNHPLGANLTAEARFLTPAELHARYTKSQAGVADTQTIAMCGSGVTACHLLLAMEAAGKPGGKLYAGSWSEWIRDSSREKAIGDGG